MTDDDRARSSPDELVSTSVAAAALGISTRTLERYVTRSLVHPQVVLPTGRYRWRVAELVAAVHALDHPPT